MKELILLGRKIIIKHVTMAELREIYPDDSVEETWGWYSPMEYTIYLYSGLEAEAYKRVLIHELTHALFNMTGLHNCLKDKHEEAACDAMENMLELFQNKKFVEEMSK